MKIICSFVRTCSKSRKGVNGLKAEPTLAANQWTRTTWLCTLSKHFDDFSLWTMCFFVIMFLFALLFQARWKPGRWEGRGIDSICSMDVCEWFFLAYLFFWSWKFDWLKYQFSIHAVGFIFVQCRIFVFCNIFVSLVHWVVDALWSIELN